MILQVVLPVLSMVRNSVSLKDSWIQLMLVGTDQLKSLGISSDIHGIYQHYGVDIACGIRGRLVLQSFNLSPVKEKRRPARTGRRL